MCVDLPIRPSGSTPGCRYCASFGLVMSTAGHCSNLRSEKLSRSWSKARTLYLETDVRQGLSRVHQVKTFQDLLNTTQNAKPGTKQPRIIY